MKPFTFYFRALPRIFFYGSNSLVFTSASNFSATKDDDKRVFSGGFRSLAIELACLRSATPELSLSHLGVFMWCFISPLFLLSRDFRFVLHSIYGQK